MTLMPGIGIAPAGNPGSPIACMGRRPESPNEYGFSILDCLIIFIYSPAGMPGNGPGRSMLPPISAPWGPMVTVPGRSMGCISCIVPGSCICGENDVIAVERKIQKREHGREQRINRFSGTIRTNPCISVFLCMCVCLCVYIYRSHCTQN